MASTSGYIAPTIRRLTSTRAYGEHWAKVAIATARVLEGSLPRRAMRMTREWTILQRVELEANWQRAQGEDPLEPVAPLP
jgi:hypothetical protein